VVSLKAKANSRCTVLSAEDPWQLHCRFLCTAAKLVVEVDGAHHFTLSQAEYDKRRSEYLEQQGLTVLRFDDRQVLLQIDSVVQAIFQAMKNPS
jgi:very-short-patch-repair endonuclease